MKLTFTNLLTLLLAFATFSGAIRKWALNTSATNNLILFVLLLFPICLLFARRDQLKESSPHTGILTFYVFALLFMAINPLNYTLYHGLLGFVLHFSFYAICFAYFNYQDEFKEDKLLKYILYTCILEFILSTIQSFSPPESWINLYAALQEGEGVALVGEAVRVTGTFSYIVGFSSFLVFAMLALCYSLRRFPEKKLNYLLIGLLVFASLISGSRGGLVFNLLTLIVFLVSETKVLIDPKIIFSVMGTLFIALLLNSTLGDPLHVVYSFEQSYNNFSDRVEANQEEGNERLTLDAGGIINNNFDYAIAGIGLGSTYQGATILFGKSPLLDNIEYEGELFRLMIEGGYILLFLRFVMLGYILFHMRFSLFFKLYLFGIICFYSSIVFNIYGSIYLSSGLILLNQAYKQRETLHYGA